MSGIKKYRPAENSDAFQIHCYLWKMLGEPKYLDTPGANQRGVLDGNRLIDAGYDKERCGKIIRFVVQDDFWAVRVVTVSKLAEFLLYPSNLDACLETNYEVWVRAGGPTWCKHKKPKDSCVMCVPPPSRESCGYKPCHGGRMNVLYPNSLDDAYGWKIHLEVACPKCKSDEFKKEVDEYPYMNAEQKKFLLEKYGKPEVL